jgi:hypothetical protein
MAERNLGVDHVTIWRRVQRYAPELRPKRNLSTHGSCGHITFSNVTARQLHVQVI